MGNATLTAWDTPALNYRDYHKVSHLHMQQNIRVYEKRRGRKRRRSEITGKGL